MAEKSGARRPWGSWKIIDVGDGYKVKRIEVLPGRRLSLQKHRHRCEHWTIVEGTARVTVDKKILLRRVNESVYVPRGAVHRLANAGRKRLVVIEVQVGSYLGEDDIVRLQDDYGRVSK